MRPLALTYLVGIYLPAAVLTLLIYMGKVQFFLYIFLVYIRVVHTFFGN